jgi:hypothetical protein
MSLLVKIHSVSFTSIIETAWEKESRCYRKTTRLKKGHEMVERYRNHLIFVKAEQDPKTALWKASSHVQFNEGPLAFRDVWLPKPTVGARTRRNAEKQMIKEARKWIDDRLLSENQAAKIVSLDAGAFDDDGGG